MPRCLFSTVQPRMTTCTMLDDASKMQDADISSFNFKKTYVQYVPQQRMCTCVNVCTGWLLVPPLFVFFLLLCTVRLLAVPVQVLYSLPHISRT